MIPTRVHGSLAGSSAVASTSTRPPHMSPRPPLPIGGLEVVSEGSSKATSASIGSPRVTSSVDQSPNSFKVKQVDSIEGSAKKRDSFKQLPTRIAALAQQQKELLPLEVLSAHEMVRTLGFTEANAIKGLERFAKYAYGQEEAMRVAVAAGAWVVAPVKGSVTDSVTTKTVAAIAHSVRGAASSICAKRLTAACSTLQNAAERLGREGGSEAGSEGSESEETARAALEVWFVELRQLQQLLQAEGGYAQLVTAPVPQTQ